MIDYKAVQNKYVSVHNDCLERTFLVFINANIEIGAELKKYNEKNGFDGATTEAKIIYTDTGKEYLITMGGMRLIDISKRLNVKLKELFELGVKYTAVFENHKFNVTDISVKIYSRTVSEFELNKIAQELSKGEPIEVSR